MEKRTFEFVDYSTEVEINGITFKLDCSSDTGMKIDRLADGLREIGEGIRAKEKTAEDAVEYGKSIINEVLGKDAVEKIWKDRSCRLSDVADICVFLAETVSKFQADRRAALMATANRATRRAAKKKK